MQSEKSLSFLATLDELKRSLQSAHFAARQLDLLLQPSPEARRADVIHELRIATGELSRRIRAAATELAHNA